MEFFLAAQVMEKDHKRVDLPSGILIYNGERYCYSSVIRSRYPDFSFSEGTVRKRKRPGRHSLNDTIGKVVAGSPLKSSRCDEL
jgi:hypothetical protein